MGPITFLSFKYNGKMKTKLISIVSFFLTLTINFLKQKSALAFHRERYKQKEKKISLSPLVQL